MINLDKNEALAHIGNITDRKVMVSSMNSNALDSFFLLVLRTK